MDLSLIISMSISAIVVVLTILIHYEALRLMTNWVLPRIGDWPQRHFVLIVICIFIAHTVEVWVFAACYYAMVNWWDLGQLSGAFSGAWHDYVYYSIVSYTTLGLGDVYPSGAIRLVTGVEAVAGLLMIGWSASYTYLVMSKHWSLDKI